MMTTPCVYCSDAAPSARPQLLPTRRGGNLHRMTRHRDRSAEFAILAAVLLMFGCGEPNSPRVPKANPKHSPPAATQVSPAVTALLKPDPDLDKKMTAEEIKATLAAAQRSAPALPAMAPRPGPGDGQWQKLESDQKAKLDEYERRLATTTVYIGPDGMYHNADCPLLTRPIMDGMGRVLEMRFVGRQTTLAYARDQHLSPHTDCGAPSYQFSYSQ